MKAEKRTFLIMLLIAAWVLLPVAVYGQEETGGPSPTPLTGQMPGNIPPVEQPLVPEGVFASELVKALKIGQSQDEAQAESMLSAVGIEPKNGWIAGYPITPPILGEIEKGVATAADAGKLGMGKDQALKTVGDLKAQFGLNVTPGATSPSVTAPSGRPASTIIYKYIDKSGVVHFTDRYESIPKEYRNQVEILRETVQPHPSVGPANEETGEQASNYAPAPPPDVIDNYYYNDGPPVVTYYAPPEPYSYLYAWVPSPFWCSGFFFPGFFILHDFHRHVFFHNHPCLVSNHVGSGFGNRVSVIDPVNRTFRRGSGLASNRVTFPQGFRSSAIQSNARTIARIGQNRGAAAGVPNGQRISPSTSMSRTFNPPASMSRTFNSPPDRGRSFSAAPPRTFSPSSISRGAFVNARPSGGSGRSSFGGFRGGGGMSMHGGSFRGGFGGHR